MAITGAAEEVQVPISGDSSELNSALDSGINRLNDFRTAVGIAGAALGTLATKQLADAVSAASDFEDVVADIEKVTGDVDVAGEVGDEIQELAETIPLTHEELGALATQAGRMGAEGADEIAAFTEVAGQMGAATTLSADEAGTALGKMSSALDEPLEDVGMLGDSINELSNSFQTTSDEIVDSTQRSGQALRTLGLQSDEILGLSAAFNEISPTSRLAATRMEAVGESMMSPDNVEAFADILGVTSDEFVEMREEAPEETMMQLLESVDGNQDALNTLNDELTTSQARAFRDAADSTDEMREAMDLSNQAMEEGGSLAREVAVETDTLSGQWTLFQNRIKNVAIDTGEVFTPYLREALALVVQAVEVFADLNERTGGVAGAIAGISVAVGGFVVAIGALLPMLTAAAGGIATVGGALLAIAAPLAIAIAAVALLATAWHTDFLGIQGITKDVLGTIREVIDNTLGAVQELWEENGEENLEAATEALEEVAEVVEEVLEYIWEGLFEPILESIEEVWEEHGEEIFAEISETMDAVLGYIETVLGAIQRAIEPVLSLLESRWDQHGDEIMTIVGAVFTWIELAVEQSMDTILTVIRVVMALIRGDWGEAWDLVAEYLDRTWDRIIGFIKGDVRDALAAAFSIVIDDAKAALNYLIGTGDGTLIGGVKSTFGSIVSWITSTGTDDVKSAISSLADSVTGVFTDTWNATLGGRTLSLPEVTISIPDWVPEIGGRSYDVGGQDLGIPELATGGRITGPGMFVGGEQGEELVLNDQQTAEADKGGVTVGDVEDDMTRALERTDRTDDVTRKLDAVIRAMEEGLDITVEIGENSSRHDPF